MSKTFYGASLLLFNRLFEVQRIANRGLPLIVTIFFTFFIMALKQFAIAEDYYWYSQSIHGTRYPTAAIGCVAKYEGHHDFFSRFEMFLQDDFGNIYAQCGVHRRSSGDRFTSFGLSRNGEGCTSPKVLDYSANSCADPEPIKCESTVRQVSDIEQQAYSTSACAAREQKGPPDSCPSPYGGNPINFAVGNKFQHESDYKVSGSSPLEFVRSYNSLDGLWRHSFSTHLRIAQDAQSIALVMAHGRESFFTVSGNSVSANSADIGVLSKTATGWQFLSVDNERFTFDSVGKLTSWSNASGGRQEFVYNSSQVSVSDHRGNNLTFTEDAEHQPLTLTAPGVQVTYSYNSNNRLTSVNRALGGQTTQRQFHYEDNRNTALLTGITDERGVRYATWSYDDQGRAVSSEHANGVERITIDYGSDGSASVTNELGKVANYQFQTILGVKRITAIEGEPSANCPNSNSTLTYDSRGLLKTKTDNKGHLTTFNYNERGLEVSRTEAAGTPQARTVTTDWHPTLFLPITVTEPSRITHYTYDDQGRQLSQSVTQR